MRLLVTTCVCQRTSTQLTAYNRRHSPPISHPSYTRLSTRLSLSVCGTVRSPLVPPPPTKFACRSLRVHSRDTHALATTHINTGSHSNANGAPLQKAHAIPIKSQSKTSGRRTQSVSSFLTSVYPQNKEKNIYRKKTIRHTVVYMNISAAVLQYHLNEAKQKDCVHRQVTSSAKNRAYTR